MMHAAPAVAVHDAEQDRQTPIPATPRPRQKRECNRHYDCDEANALARRAGYPAASHCHDEDCEDCFGS